MRKRLLCTVLLLLLLLPVFPASAQEEQVQIRIETVDVDADGSSRVKILLDANPGVTSIKLKIAYDASALQLVRVDENQSLGGWFESSQTEDVNPHVLVWVWGEPTEKTGTLAILRFQTVRENIQLSTEIQITHAEVICNGSDVPVSLTNGTVYFHCEHVFGDWTMTDETRHGRLCANCQRYFYQEHIWDAGVVERPASHTVPGSIRYSCSICKGEKTEEIPTLSEHTYTYERLDSDTHRATCACGDTQVLSHEWKSSTVTQEPSHTVPGNRRWSCPCGESRDEEIPTTPEHEYVYERLDANLHRATCACGDSVEQAHEWKESTVTLYPSHTAPGNRRLRCPCGEERDEEIPPTPEHTYQIYEPCDKQNHNAICACGDAIVQPHEWKSSTVTKPATHTVPGNRRYQCVCGETRDEEIPTTSAHVYHTYESRDESNHVAICACGHTIVQSHTWDEGRVILEPTAEAEGSRQYTCLSCGATRAEPISQLRKGPDFLLIGLIVGAILAVVAAILIVLWMRKKKTTTLPKTGPMSSVTETSTAPILPRQEPQQMPEEATPPEAPAQAATSQFEEKAEDTAASETEQAEAQIPVATAEEVPPEAVPETDPMEVAPTPTEAPEPTPPEEAPPAPLSKAEWEEKNKAVLMALFAEEEEQPLPEVPAEESAPSVPECTEETLSHETFDTERSDEGSEQTKGESS